MEHVLAVVGDPVSHSLSPVMHRAALAWAGFSGTYDAIRCDPGEFRDLILTVRNGEYTGLNVTMPHKEAAYDLIDVADSIAATSGSVNTLKMKDGKLLGTSTDTTAMSTILETLGESDSPILVLGSGGAAAAVLASGGGRFALSARNRSRAEDLVARFGDVDIEVLPFGAGLAGAIVVNATPLGMNGELLPGGIIDGAVALIDLPYGPTPTPAVRQAQEMGLNVFDGFRFLALQAAASFGWWTGDNVPVEVFEDAARNG